MVERYLEDEKCQMRMHEQGYSPSNMEELDRTANEDWTYVALSYERAYCRGSHKVVQPHQGGGSDTIGTKERPGYNQVVQWKREIVTKQASEPDAEQ